MSKFTNSLAPPPKQKTPTYNMTRAQLDAMAEEAYNKGQREAIPIVNAMCMLSMLLALNSHLGFGRKRLTRVFNAVQKYFAEISSGEITHSDISRELDRLGVNLICEGLDGESAAVTQIFEAAERGVKLKVRIK